MKLRIVLLVASFSLLASCGSELPPNIIIVHVDDLGWTDLGCFGSGYYETPHIDRLAGGGMSFTNAYAAAAVCSPSRAALLTGQYPARLGITDWIRASFNADAWEPGTPIPEFESVDSRRLSTPVNQPYLPHEEITLAEHLKPAGYVTAHIGKWHLGREDWFPDSQGFDYNIGGCDFGQPPSYFDPYQNERVRGIPTLPPRREGEYLTEREGDEAVGFIRSHKDAAFFIYYAPYAVHTPIQAKPAVEARYEAKVKTNQTNPAYAAMVESVDDAVGRIMATLEELKLAERTLVLFTSDNGGLMRVTDNAPLRDGKGSPYEGGIRVPLIAWWPGNIPPGAQSDAPISSIDYLPTVAEALGVPLDHSVDGQSLWKTMSDGDGAEERDLFWHFPQYRYNQVGPYSIVRSRGWKLIRYYDPEPYGVNRVELFNLATDLGEKHDLAGEQTEKAKELEALLDAWLETVGARLPVEQSEV
jgi:arylsulfatase A-like enzyme